MMLLIDWIIRIEAEAAPMTFMFIYLSVLYWWCIVQETRLPVKSVWFPNVFPLLWFPWSHGKPQWQAEKVHIKLSPIIRSKHSGKELCTFKKIAASIVCTIAQVVATISQFWNHCLTLYVHWRSTVSSTLVEQQRVQVCMSTHVRRTTRVTEIVKKHVNTINRLTRRAVSKHQA